MYRNVCSYLKGGKQVIWESTWDSEGNRIEIESEIKPHLYYEDSQYKSAECKSMYDKPLRKVEFETSFDRNEWIKSSKNTPLYEKLSPEKQYLLNKYYGQEQSQEFMKYDLRIFFIDIEIQIENCFPNPEEAAYPINVISLYDTLTKTMHIWTFKKDIDNILTDKAVNKITSEINAEYEKDVKINIYKFDKEILLLNNFIKFWESNYPDVVSGWNIDAFDIPYIINRIKVAMPKNYEKRLSPIYWHKYAVKEKSEQKLKKIVMNYHIMGISICDYLNLYKKFILKSQQSFKLDYISKMELGTGKLDYYEMGYESMKEFMEKDFATFVKYNIIDTMLVKMIDDERHFIKLMRRICNMGLCEYESIYKSIPYILGALCIEARNKGVKLLTDANRDEDNKFESDGFEGAFVYPTKAGFYPNGIMSFDFNSLYPNVICTINLSPETYVGKVVSEIGEKDDNEVYIKLANNQMRSMSKQSFEELLKNKCSIGANNTLYIKSTIKQGIIPSFLTKLYSGRVAIKSEMKKNKKLIQQCDEEIAQLEKELEKLK